MQNSFLKIDPYVKEGHVIETFRDFLYVTPEHSNPMEAGTEISMFISPETLSPEGFLVVDYQADSEREVTFVLEFYTGSELRFMMRSRMVPNARAKCVFELRFLDSSRAYPRKLDGSFKAYTEGAPTDLKDVTAVWLKVPSTPNLQGIRIYGLYSTESLPDLTVEGEPLVDSFGQNRLREFPGKIHSENELREYLERELSWAEANDAYPDAAYDLYGGYAAGPKFAATGRFYLTEKDGRAFFVDPLGNPFFSNGVCYGYRTGIYGMTDGFSSLFESLPDPEDSLFSKAYVKATEIPEFVKRNGREEAEKHRLVNFPAANFMRVFGEKWKEKYLTITRARLKKWGFNTLSVGVNDYGNEDTVNSLRFMKMPYTVTCKDFPMTETRLFRDFPDVFSREFSEKCEGFAEQLRPFSDDPYFIGYFVTNEPEWMFERHVNIAEIVWNSPTESETKKALRKVLSKRYDGSVPDDLKETDFLYLRDVMIEKYVSVSSEALRKAAPGALNLGMRYSSVQEGDFAGAEAFSVFSFNCYKKDPGEVFKIATEKSTRPFLVGEYQFGSLESGLLSGALITGKTEADRGTGIAEYLRRAFLTPRLVGVHYFEYNDQPLLGRFDGENMQIGFVNVCNKPYEICMDKVAAMNKKMYSVLFEGEVPPEEKWEAFYRF